VLTTLSQNVHGCAVLKPDGVLDARTYRQVRDAVTKAAVDQATAVIVDVDGLTVPDDHAWSVFTSARWLVQQWPQVVVALAASSGVVRRRLALLSVSRYVPVYASVADAARAIGDGACRYRRRARTRFAQDSASVHGAQYFVNDHLMQWSMHMNISAAVTVATVLVENALEHAGHGCDLRLEAGDSDVVVAVTDSSQALAVRRERLPGSEPAGLDIVAELCRSWGNTPVTAGKTVWARVGHGDVVAGLARLLDNP
jgi:anti-anti-sigma regulatory factor